MPVAHAVIDWYAELDDFVTMKMDKHFSKVFLTTDFPPRSPCFGV